MFLFFFFFQAEDGIRDGTVTGVQTCALPIFIDAINTATAISYQNEFELAIETKELIDGFRDRTGDIPRDELEPLFATIRKLLIAQGIPQIARHVLLLHETLKNTDVAIYVKVGTTGTGGMGLNIPYTHSEDKP